MAKSGLKHVDVGDELTKTEWESEDSHEVVHGASFPGSPVERQLFYRDDEHKWYIYTGAAWADLTGGDGGMSVHGNEYHDPDFAEASHTHSDLSPAHKDQSSGVHGVGAGTIAKVSDIAVDSNLSSAAQDSISKKHTQNTDKSIKDADGDTVWEVEQSPDEDKIRGKVKGVEAFLLEDTGILTLVKQSAARAYLSANQSILNATWTKINFDAEAFDIQNEFDIAANHRFTAKTVGIYLVVGVALIYQLADGTGVFTAIYKNGSPVAEGRVWVSKANESASGMILGLFSLAANDYLELWVYHTHGSSRDAYGQERYTSLSVCKVA